MGERFQFHLLQRKAVRRCVLWVFSLILFLLFGDSTSVPLVTAGSESRGSCSPPSIYSGPHWVPLTDARSVSLCLFTFSPDSILPWLSLSSRSSPKVTALIVAAVWLRFVPFESHNPPPKKQLLPPSFLNLTAVILYVWFCYSTNCFHWIQYIKHGAVELWTNNNHIVLSLHDFICSGTNTPVNKLRVQFPSLEELQK